MEDREQWFTLLAQKDWEAIGKIIYQKKKAKVQDPFLTQMTGFFESEFFTFAEPLPPAERSRQFEYTNLIIELNQHGFSQGFVDRFVDERLKLMQETKHTALLNYAQTHQHRPLAKEIIQSFLRAKPEAVSASLRTNMTVRATEVTPGEPKTIRLFKSKQEENFYEAVRRVFPTFHPYPNVALSCVLDYQAIKDQLSEKARSYFFRGIVDSVVFDVGSGYVPKYFIELDSSFHDDPQAQANDLLKDAIFRAANTKLIRIRPLDAKASSVEEFERLVRELMRQL
ncbi:DUF2726 domain-containing protein [Pseudomonas syringae group genomosp. 3]|jgi:hypothetical protein|uniref:Conserved domain protein n=2 Tax=Pseudomonas syringae group TaxID=136849 RepID=Q87W13_PSESM|nr:DUF2726 domain-containing protein [Pseudomonas syringae group genomosp. 3]AAO58200.1 conserved domain protein [Pseudomonas syringae pv. tomato str. DC3000]KKI26033.1 hypothetical protein WX98_12125 [Pseudomonas syringae pv. persicae]KPB94467.1 hypothetical protein AC502_2906 [Pseudomonas syringae pv. maculicola]KPY95210.1 hypothetical protein ALO36_101814 [Pseudomonas syringae pv. tomato]